MDTVAVLIPSLGRCEQLRQRVTDLLQQQTVGVCMVVIIAVQSNDHDTIRVVNELMRHIPAGGNEIHAVERMPGTTAVDGWLTAFDYARANDADWYVLGADDIEWQPGWLAEALRVADESGALVIGLNDGGHTDLNHYAPHYMMHKLYADHMGFIPDGYKTWWFDRDVCEAAQHLGLYAPAWDAVAVHHHPDWENVPVDSTYVQAMPLRDDDRLLYEKRKQKRVIA